MNRTTLGKKLGSYSLSLVLLLTAISFAAGSAAAHDCKAYNGCDASACKDGEDHEHTDMNYVGRDGYCKSTSKPPKRPDSCEYFGQEWPPLVCSILERTLPPPPALPGSGSGPCLEKIDGEVPYGNILAEHGHRLLDGPC